MGYVGTGDEGTLNSNDVSGLEIGTFLKNATAYGVPFQATVKLASAAATTKVYPITDAQVAAIAGASGYVKVTNVQSNVNGATAWTGAGTVVTLKDTASSPLTFVSYAKAQLTGNAFLPLGATGVTTSDPIYKGTGTTAGKGLAVVADGAFAGSDLYVTVEGYIVKP